MSSRRPCPRSQAAAPLDDDNLLSEILLRLPPLPSSLPRASAVCRRWRSLASDPAFSRRFRLHHRRNPPLLGFFHVEAGLSFVPTLPAPNRVSPERLSWHWPRDAVEDGRPLGCRHGLALILNRSQNQVLVWDPVTGDKHRIAVPPGFDVDETPISGAVLRGAGGAHNFQVALVGNGEKQNTEVVACVYSSETGVWGDLISTPLPSEDPDIVVSTFKPAVLVGDSLYWLLTGSSDGILEFDLDRKRLSVVPMPVDLDDVAYFHFSVIRADGGGLGFLILSDFNAQLWKRKTDCDGITSWVLGRTIEINGLLPQDVEERNFLIILAYAEDNDVALMWTDNGLRGFLFMIQLKSLKFEELLETNTMVGVHSFESIYTAETGIGGGIDGADFLHST